MLSRGSKSALPSGGHILAAAGVLAALAAAEALSRIPALRRADAQGGGLPVSVAESRTSRQRRRPPASPHPTAMLAFAFSLVSVVGLRSGVGNLRNNGGLSWSWRSHRSAAIRDGTRDRSCRLTYAGEGSERESATPASRVSGSAAEPVSVLLAAAGVDPERTSILHEVISTLRAAVSRQLSHPSGVRGRVIALLMNRGNRGLNDRGIDLLDVRPSSRVLDLGFGGGVTLSSLLERAAQVTGVDRAEDMVDAARARHRNDVASGRLILATGDVARLPLDDGAVDRTLTVNTVYFWRDLPTAFREIRRVLAPGGRIVIGIRDRAVMQHVDRDVFTIRTPSELAESLTRAGFDRARVVAVANGTSHLVTATS